MTSRQADESGYNYTGVYSRDKEEIKERIVEEKKKGNKAVIVNTPTSGYARGYKGMGYSMYVIKSPANLKAEKIKYYEIMIKNTEFKLKEKLEEIKELEGIKRRNMIELYKTNRMV